MDCFHLAAAALTSLGHHYTAAVLTGKADTMAGRIQTSWWIEMLAATDARLLEVFGERQVAILAAQGAALDNADAVAYLRTQAGTVLHEH
jgi:hypothetical protein